MASVTLAAHQPAYLAARRVIDKIAAVDVMVLQDDLQFTRRDFQHRNRIGGGRWLTIPVHASQHTEIRDVRPADRRWLDKHDRIIQAAYPRRGYSLAYWNQVKDIISSVGVTAPLSLLGEATMVFLAQAVGSDPHLIRQSTLSLTKDETRTPTDRLITLCQRFGASRYLSGQGGHLYLEVSKFHAAGIEVAWHDFTPPPAVDGTELSMLHDLITADTANQHHHSVARRHA